MKIKDRPEYTRKGQVLTFPPDTKVSEAVNIMSERNIGSTVVVNPDGTPCGIVTERDLMRRVLAKGADMSSITLKDIMTADLKLAKPDDDLTEWLRQMSNDRFRHLPIVDTEGKVVNIMSQGDFVSYTWPLVVERVKDKAKSALFSYRQLAMIIGAVMVYTLIMVLIFSSN